MSDKTFHVKIRNTDKVIFEGAADRISSYNEIGPFDVYRMHANFISIIKKELILYNNRQKIQEVKFEQAIMKVKQDKASIFLGIEILQLEESQNYTNLSNSSGK